MYLYIIYLYIYPITLRNCEINWHKLPIYEYFDSAHHFCREKYSYEQSFWQSYESAVWPVHRANNVDEFEWSEGSRFPANFILSIHCCLLQIQVLCYSPLQEAQGKNQKVNYSFGILSNRGIEFTINNTTIIENTEKNFILPIRMCLSIKLKSIESIWLSSVPLEFLIESSQNIKHILLIYYSSSRGIDMLFMKRLFCTSVSLSSFIKCHLSKARASINRR